MPKRILYLVAAGVLTLLAIFKIATDKEGWSLLTVIPLWFLLVVILVVLYLTSPLRKRVEQRSASASTNTGKILFALLGGITFAMLGAWIMRWFPVLTFIGLFFYLTLLRAAFTVIPGIIGYSFFYRWYQGMSSDRRIVLFVISVIIAVLSYFFLFTQLGISILSVL